MFIRQRQHKGILVILLVVMGGLQVSVLSHYAVADDIATGSYTFITSRFILWDTTEKMIDPTFNINMVYINNSNNHTAYYEIKINDMEYNGSFEMFYTQNITLNNTENIMLFEVKINNITTISAEDINVIKGVNKRGISRSRQPFTINLSPFEWEAMEWNIFLSICTASLISIFIGYRLVLRYRKIRGVREVK